jgi:hypothetical protein
MLELFIAEGADLNRVQYDLTYLKAGECAEVVSYRLLYICARRSEEASRLSLIQALTHRGFDGDEIDPPNVRLWPRPYTYYRNQSAIADPFYIEFFGVLLRNAPGNA